MRYRHVCLEAVSYLLPPDVVSSEQIEQQLEPVYNKLGLNVGRLELMSGITTRRFFPHGTRPSDASILSARAAVEASQLPQSAFGALIHGSVCRDQLEPATANRVHHELGLPASSFVFDISNACLGLMNGAILIADLIEAGRIQAGVVVGTEIGRPLVEGTIQTLLNDDTLTRQSIKSAFASLTIGSGSAAFVLCDRKLSQHGTSLLGGEVLSNTETYRLCEGGSVERSTQQGSPLMETDSEALLHAGVDLADATWRKFSHTLGWNSESIDRVITHQVGRAHRKLLLDRLQIEHSKDSPTVQDLGNTGAVALPTALGVAIDQQRFSPNHSIGLFGIGSGLNCIMLGLDWQNCPVQQAQF